MRRVYGLFLVLSVFTSELPTDALARGRIGGGSRGSSRSAPRGGFSGRGTPSRSVPSRSSINRSPSFSMPQTGSSRIGSGTSRSIGSGSLGSNRSGVTIRPGVGSRGLQTGSRPQIGSGSRVGSGSRIGSGTAGSGRIGSGQFPGLNNRSTIALPGLGSGNAGQQLKQRYPDLNRDNLRQQIGGAGDSRTVSREKIGAWREQQGVERARTPERRQDLQERLSEVDRDQWQERRGENVDDRQEFREGRQEDWQQYREGAREDWQNFYDDNYYHHYDWHHGGWHEDWHDHWDHMWHEHPAAVAFGLTCWGVNTAGYVFGTWGYSNPYYVESSGGINYSEPQIVVQQTVTDGGSSELPEVPGAGLDAFEQARAAFYAGNYAEARRLCDEALKSMPHDAVVHEFRALTLFAEGHYTGTATVLHSVLAVGPGWDWTTMSQLYPSTEAYTTQLRALEDWTEKHSSLPDGHFVLAYHYLTCGHSEPAAEQLKIVVKTLPDDSVSARLLSQLTGEAPTADGSETPTTPTAVTIKSEALIGEWKANGAAFQLKLAEDGRFTWSFKADGKTQGVGGVYAVDASTLAMEPDAGGVMLAVIRLEGARMTFQQVGTGDGAAPLVFEKQ